MEAKPYDPLTVPASPGDRSRFALDHTPAGHTASPAVSIIAAYGRCWAALKEKVLTPVQPDVVTVELRKLVRLEGEGWTTVHHETLKGRPVFSNKRPTKYVKRSERGGDFLDRFLTNPEYFATYPDASVYEALIELADEDGLRGTRWGHLLTLNRTIWDCLASRAGLQVDLSAL